MPSQIRKRVKSNGVSSWQIRVKIGENADGKAEFVTTTHETLGAAKIALGKILGERQSGSAIKPSEIRVATFLDDWFESTAKIALRENTFQNYKNMAQNHVVPQIGKAKLRELTPSMISKRVYRPMLDAGISAKTVRLCHSLIHSAFGQAVVERLVTANPADGIKLPRIDHTEIVCLGANEARALLAAAKGDRLEAFFHVQLSAGLRPSETMALTWDDVDLKQGTVTVTKSLVRDSKGWYIRPPKRKSSKRTVPLPAPTVDALRSWKATQAAERLAVASIWEDHGFVFTNGVGGPLNITDVRSRDFAAICARAGLGEWVPTGRTYRRPPRTGEPVMRFRPSVTVYCLRHTCATLMLAAGINPKIASERLGHASVSITLDTYSHVSPTMQADATDKIGAALYGA